MGTSDDNLHAAAMKALVELFSRSRQPAKSRYSGIRCVPEIQNGEVVFVRNLDDVAIHKAFDDVLDELFGAAKSDIDSKSKE